MNKTLIYITLMVLTVNLIRILPVTLIHGKIRNHFVRSFLYYVPYVTLSVMTFPAIIEATQSPIAGTVALIIGIIAAWMNLGLFPVAAICCAVVFIIEALF